MKTHTIIIWETIPENTEIFLVPDEVLTEEQHKLVSEAHGLLINGNSSTEVNGLAFLNMAFANPVNKEDASDQESKEKYFECYGMLHQYKKYNFENDNANPLLNIKEPITVSKIIFTGFVL